MKFTHGIKIAATTAVAALALSACATGAPDSASSAENVSDIKTLTVGVLSDAAPFSSENMETREFEGFEIELARALAQDAVGKDVEIVFEPVTKATRIPMVQGNEVDMLLATLSITDERREVLDFSVPYYSSPNGIMVTEDSPITKVSELAGAKLCVPQGSAVWDSFRGSLEKMPEYAKLPDSFDLVELPSPADCLLALRQGRGVDVVVNDASTLTGQIAEVGGVRMLDELIGADDNVFGIAFNQQNTALREAIDTSLCGMFADGRWAEIYEQTLNEQPREGWAPDCSAR